MVADLILYFVKKKNQKPKTKKAGSGHLGGRLIDIINGVCDTFFDRQAKWNDMLREWTEWRMGLESQQNTDSTVPRTRFSPADI